MNTERDLTKLRDDELDGFMTNCERNAAWFKRRTGELAAQPEWPVTAVEACIERHERGAERARVEISRREQRAAMIRRAFA